MDRVASNDNASVKPAVPVRGRRSLALWVNLTACCAAAAAFVYFTLIFNGKLGHDSNGVQQASAGYAFGQILANALFPFLVVAIIPFVVAKIRKRPFPWNGVLIASTIIYCLLTELAKPSGPGF
jgi:hypothetical protein